MPARWTPLAVDVLALQCDAQALARIVPEAGWAERDKRPAPAEAPDDDLTVMEAAITPGTPTIGKAVERLHCTTAT